MLVKSNNIGMMYRIRLFTIIFFFLVATINARAEIGYQPQQKQQTIQKDVDLSQDFYKATVQAYKDFNEQVVRYVSIALTIVSAFVTGLVILFVFLFRKTLADIRKDINDDADRINNVYSKTFELLNKQADTNLHIFQSRETDLNEKIQEAKRLIEIMRDYTIKIADKESIREPLAEELSNKELENVEKESVEVKKEMDTLKADLENLSG